jgi:ATP dependent DNA ligase-like protein
MMLRSRRSPPAGFIEPCLPSSADRHPTGPDWIHEIKLDGFRLMVRRDPAGVRLLTRNGIDWTGRFPLIAEAAGALQVMVVPAPIVPPPNNNSFNPTSSGSPAQYGTRYELRVRALPCQT